MSITLTEYCDILFSTSTLPYFVVDNHTEEILYANATMHTLLKTEESVVCKIFHHLILHKNFEFPHHNV